MVTCGFTFCTVTTHWSLMWDFWVPVTFEGYDRYLRKILTSTTEVEPSILLAIDDFFVMRANGLALTGTGLFRVGLKSPIKIRAQYLKPKPIINRVKRAGPYDPARFDSSNQNTQKTSTVF
ncbi:hypothetical protein MTR_3g090775 [Medicago truncatula]|uniref:Uncharacterized protein n=1 Tax=Medicago truncatula TaxID=3880 RepID=A0A072V0B3_MEDTR|nr:hypothetical protein MTR_3g090775 [Medicago truncatula]